MYDLSHHYSRCKIPVSKENPDHLVFEMKSRSGYSFMAYNTAEK